MKTNIISKEDKTKTWDNKPCLDRSHNFPNMLYIPPGQSHTHTCPSCGYKITVTSPDIRC